MISFFSSWVKNLALALIIVSILEMILPNNKIKKYVKVVMGLYILFSIISPFIENRGVFNNIDLMSYVQNPQATSSTVETIDQTSMDTRLNQIYKDELKKDIIKKVNEIGYEVENCKVIAHVSQNDSGIEKIVLNISGKVIYNNVNIEKIENVNINISTSEEQTQQTNISKADIKIVKDLLINEYGVNESCLKIN